MEQRDEDFQARLRRQELTDRELYGVCLSLGENDFTTAGDILYLVTTDEGWSFESIELADQVLKDRHYTVAKYYFLEVADGIFETWRDLLYEEEGLYSDIFRKVNLLTRRVWNYGYLKMRFTVDDFCLDKTLAHEFNDPPRPWRLEYPVSYPHTER